MTSTPRGTKRAKPLDPEAFEHLLAFALQRSRVPASDRLKLLLSFKAGLRACEIARMKVTDLLDVEGQPARMIEVFSWQVREVPPSSDAQGHHGGVARVP